jgi:outer membrane protein OmpA-like peptidoglycan-associated protein
MIFFGRAAFAEPIPSSYRLSLDARTFEAAASPYNLLGTHGSRLMPHLFFFGQIVTDYAKDPLLIRNLTTGQIVSRPIAHRLTSEIAFAMGLFSWVEAGVSLPVYWLQQAQGFPLLAEESQTSPSLEATNIGDLRLWAKIRILENSQAGGLGMAAILEASFPTGGAFLMRQASATFTPRLVMDFRWGQGGVIALNAAFRLRSGSPTEEDLLSSQDIARSMGSFRVGNELRLSLAAEIPLFAQGISLLGEFATHTGFSDTPEATALFGAELLLGLRWRHHSGLILSAGAGAGLSSSYGSPDFRVFLQIAFGRPLQPIAARPYEPAVMLPEKPPMTKKAPPVTSQTKEPPMPARPAMQAHRAVDASAFAAAIKNDPDPDGDGIPAPQDKCPLEPEDFDGFQDEDGCPDPDNDGDGIPDHLDKCPNEPETFNDYKDEDGCPDTLPEEIAKKRASGQRIELTAKQLKLKDRIYFGTDSDKIQPRSYEILRQLAIFLKNNRMITRLEVQGHTDNRGDREKNVDLSERRARRVVLFLIQEGVETKRLRSKGYGPKTPIADNRSAKGRALNRRVQFMVQEMKRLVPVKPQGSQPPPAATDPSKKGGTQ